MKVGTNNQMREMNQQAVHDYKIPEIILMENAALSVIEVLIKRFGLLCGKRVAVVCGPGNNGGDGLAIARRLAIEHKAFVTIVLANASNNYTGCALINFEMTKKLGIQSLIDKNFDFSTYEFIIDAIFGIGFKGVVSEELGHLIQNMNESGRPIVSVDAPSGLNIDSGRIEGPVVRASQTVTFTIAKYGQLVYPGAEYVGELIIKDIGIPAALLNASKILTYATETKDVAHWLPTRKNSRDSNKKIFGHVVAFAGSRGFMGAAVLVAEAAERSGAGLVTVAVSEDILQSVLNHVSPTVMTFGLPTLNDSKISALACEVALKLIAKATSVALGPGLGLTDGVTRFIRAMIIHCPCPLVLDADAITFLSLEADYGADLIKNRKAATILTPHPGELGRLLGVETSFIQADRQRYLKMAVEKYNCVILLKGARTLISDPSGAIYVNVTGNAGMSNGGTGDALTGIIAGLLAQELEALPAAVVGAFLHGLASDIVKKNNSGAIGLNAMDLIQHLPQAIAQCQNSSNTFNLSILQPLNHC